MSVTIKDIAKETNISVATVARALKYPEKVNEKKRKLILATADKLGYIPNINACNLKTNTSTNIGFIINDVQNTFFNSLIRVVEKELSDNGYKLMISFGTDDKVEIEDKIKNFLSTSVCAILFSPNLHSNYIENLLKKKEVYTLQLFSKYYDCFDSLIVDDTNGTYLATKRLLHDKHEKIMLIGLNDVIWQERVKGYKKAIIEAGLKINENLIVTIDNSEFLVDKISTMIVKENVTSIIPIAGKIGVATIKALNTLKLSISKDISVICYDDSVWAELLNLTVITHPIKELGSKIAKMIINGIKNKTELINGEIIEPFILERGSVNSKNNK